MVAALSGALLSGLGAIFSYLLSIRAKRLQERAEEVRQRLFREEAFKAVRERGFVYNITSTQADYIEDLGELSWHWSMDAPPSREEIREEVQGAVTAFQERLERIEQRFPEEATLEKIASINDAILATKLEYLDKSLKEIESRFLTKWDVATIVFAVIGGIGVAAGVIFTVANFVLK